MTDRIEMASAADTTLTEYAEAVLEIVERDGRRFWEDYLPASALVAEYYHLGHEAGRCVEALYKSGWA